jgi:hypothetical protein
VRASWPQRPRPINRVVCVFGTQCVALCHCDLTLLMAHDLVAAMKDFPDSAEKARPGMALGPDVSRNLTSASPTRLKRRQT